MNIFNACIDIKKEIFYIDFSLPCFSLLKSLYFDKEEF